MQVLGLYISDILTPFNIVSTYFIGYYIINKIFMGGVGSGMAKGGRCVAGPKFTQFGVAPSGLPLGRTLGLQVILNYAENRWFWGIFRMT